MEGSNTVSTEEAARIRAEVHAVMAQKLATGQRQLGSNPVMQNSPKSGAAISDTEVIDLITQSIASLQKLLPTVIPSSPISVASTLPIPGMEGTPRGFLIYRLDHTFHPHRHHSPLCSGSPRNLHVSMSEALRMSIHGHPLCATTSHYGG